MADARFYVYRCLQLTVRNLFGDLHLFIHFFYFTVGTDNGLAGHADHGGYGARVSGRPLPHAHTAHEETVHVAAVLSVFVNDARGCSPNFSNARLQPGKCT